jgi:hypothetical protein
MLLNETRTSKLKGEIFMKKLFYVLFVVALIFAFTGTSMACPPWDKVTGESFAASGVYAISGDVTVEPDGTIKPGDDGFSFISGGSEANGKYAGKGFEDVLYGATGSISYTDVHAYTNYAGTFSKAKGLTVSGSFAVTNGYPGPSMVKIHGSGQIAHGTFATNGTAAAYTAGSASYTYKAKANNFVAGGGIAGTYGWSKVTQNGATAFSASFSASGVYTGSAY